MTKKLKIKKTTSGFSGNQNLKHISNLNADIITETEAFLQSLKKGPILLNNFSKDDQFLEKLVANISESRKMGFNVELSFLEGSQNPYSLTAIVSLKPGSWNGRFSQHLPQITLTPKEVTYV